MTREADGPATSDRVWRVGDLAERCGLSVRTLHHYDAIGLLRPSGRTVSAHGSGHRLYTASDVERLQQVLSLKDLGFGLDQIRESLDQADYDPRRVIRQHLDKVRERAAAWSRLERRLTALAEALETSDVASVDAFLTTIQEMAMIGKYYTPEQMDQIKARGEEVGAERIREVEAEWPRLQAEVRSAMDSGLPPSDARAQDLARRWCALVDEFTGGDPAIVQSLNAMYRNEDRIHGMDVAAMRPMMDYIGEASRAAGIKLAGT